MTNLRSKSNTRNAARRAAPKTKPTIETPSSNPNLSEAALRKLTRSELQKLAMAHKVRANMKSEEIIRQLSSLQIPQKKRSAEDEPEEGPSRKKSKRDAAPERDSNSPENRVTPLQDTESSRNTFHASANDPLSSKDGLSTPILQERTTPTPLSYDNNLFSGTESEATEEEQLDYATPISTRSETPPAANVNDLKRCVTIMQEISARDVALLKEVASMRETATKLRKKARDVRDLVKAERARRERMEAYFRYWQEIDPNWDRQWLYGEGAAPHEDSNGAAGPSTVPGGQESQQPDTEVRGRKPALSPDEVKRKRQAIIAKQEAEQRQLEALQGGERQGENFSDSEWSSGAADEGSMDGAELPTRDNHDVNGPLMILFESNAGANRLRGPSL